MPINPEMLVNLTDASTKNKEFLQRQFDYEEERISNPEYLAIKIREGWQEVRRLKTGKIVIQRPKENDVALEDRAWRLLHQLGYDELNTGRSFYIPPRGSQKDHRQVDVFGKDDETVVIVECKTQSKLNGKNLSMFINDLAHRRQTMMDCVRRHYENNDLKLITLLVTDGIIWSELDEKLAVENKVFKVSEREMKYYTEIARSLGPAAKYQFHAEFLKDQKVRALQLSFPAISQKIGGKKAYIFSAPASKLIKLAFVNHRELKDPQSAPSYQRMLKRSRLSQVATFINGGGYFANSILVSMSEGTKQSGRFEQKEKSDDFGISYGILRLPEYYKSLRVIDGQHRLYGAAESDRKDAPVIVVALVNIKEEEEARLFKEINKEQKGVDASLITSLEGALGADSKDPAQQLRSLGARIVDFLIDDPYYPFANSGGDLKSATITSALVSSGLIGTVRKDKVQSAGILTGRNADETMQNALSLLGNYFSRIKNANLMIWNGDFGKRTVGAPSSSIFVAGHIAFLAACARQYCNDKSDSRSFQKTIEPFLNGFCGSISAMSIDEYREKFMNVNYGGAGQDEFKFRVAMVACETNPDFEIAGLKDKRHATDRSRIEASVSLAKTSAAALVRMARMHIASNLNENFWSAEAGYLPMPMVTKLMRRKAAAKEAAGKSFENYLEFSDLAEFLVKKSEVWDCLKQSFNIKTDASLPGVKKHISWMSVIGKIASSEHIQDLSDLDEKVVRQVHQHLSQDNAYVHISSH